MNVFKAFIVRILVLEVFCMSAEGLLFDFDYT